MLAALARFVDSLRQEGLSPSPAELLDAARAVDAVGPERRERFRAGLRAALVKRRRDLAAFDAAFDRFFVAPAPPGREKGERGRGEGVGSGGGKGSGHRAPAVHKTPPSGPRGRARAHRRSADPGKERARDEAARSRQGERERGPALGSDPRRADLTRPMGTEEERRLARLVPRLVEQLRLRPGRRMRKDRRGRLWARQVFRANLGQGGVPFVLPFRRPRRRKPRVLLLVDVSHSTARAAGFFLWMAAAFVRMGRQARVALFVDRPVDATRAVERWTRTGGPDPTPSCRRGMRPGSGIAPRHLSFADLLEGIPGLNLGAPSDYGRTFHALLSSPLRPAGRGTVLVVLGDGRTNRFDPLPWALEELARRSGPVLWLVSEPRARWGTADSALERYLPHTDLVVEASDLEGLAQGVASLMRSV